MLSKKNRLKGTANFERIFKYGEKFFSPYFVVYRLKHSTVKDTGENTSKLDLSDPHIGFISSKKVGGAVQRNHARRILSEAIRLNILENGKAPNADYIFIIKNELLNCSVEALKEETSKLL